MLVKLIPERKGPFDDAGKEEITVDVNPDHVHTFFPITNGTRLYMAEGHQIDLTSTFEEVVEAKKEDYASRYPARTD